MKKLGIETWKQRTFYGLIAIIGYFFQPNWFYQNFYSNPKFRDGATWVPPFAIYSAISAVLLVVMFWSFIRLAKKYL